MKFQCDRCKTRYSIADEKVRGKILKIRCKACDAAIVVREGDGQAEGPRRAAEPAGPPGPGASGGLSRRTIELSALSGQFAAVAEAAAPAPDPEPPPAPAVAPDEWYLSVDGDQQGPFPLEEAQRRVARRAPGLEMFAWRDDFPDWLPIEEVPVLVAAPPRRPPPPPRPTSRAEARASSSPVASGSSPTIPAGLPAARPAPEGRHASPTSDQRPGAYARSSSQRAVAVAPAGPARKGPSGPLRVPDLASLPSISAAQPAPAKPSSGRLRPVPAPGAEADPPARGGAPAPAADPPVRGGAPVATRPAIPGTKSFPPEKHVTAVADPFDQDPEAEEDLTPPPVDLFEFNIGEASRVVKLPIRPPSQPSLPVAQPPPAEAPVAAAPSAPAPAAAPAAPAEPPLVPAPADAPRQRAPAAAGRSLAGGGARVPGGAALAPPRRRRLAGPLLVGAIAISGLVAALVLVLRVGEPDRRAVPGARDDLLVSDFYRRDNPLLGGVDPPRPPAAAAGVEPAAASPGAAGAAPAPAAKAAPARPAAAPPPPVVVASGRPRVELPARGDEPARIAPAARGKQDTFDEDAWGGEALTPDDVRSAYAANEVGLKRCYERALKVDPQNAVSKMQVKITISPKGNVSEISVPDRSALATCVQASVRAWRFRRSNGEFTTEFTVFFARRG